MRFIIGATILSILFGVLEIQAQHSGRMNTGAASVPDSRWSELNSGMDKMHATVAAIDPSGDTDLDFVRLMLPHHQAAIDMAKAELKYGTDSRMRRMAEEIITDQQSEIELMQFWLRQHSSSTDPNLPRGR